MANTSPNMIDSVPDWAWPSLFALATALIGSLIGYRLGLQSKREEERLKAKNALLSEIDKFLFEIEKRKNVLTDIFSQSKRELRGQVFAFSSQLKTKRGKKVNEEWQKYDSLEIKSALIIPGQTNREPERFDREKKSLAKQLNNLREIVSHI